MKYTGNLIIVICTLLTLAGSVNAADSPLHKAVQKGDKTLVESLLSSGSDVNARDWSGDTPLHFAAYFGMNEIIESLLAKGADINAMSKVMAPLHMAVDAGRTDTVELLLTRGADINVKDINGNTPLHHAAMFQGNKGVVEFLLTKGADITAKNKNGATPQEEAVRLGKKDIVELLKEHLVNRAKQAGRAADQIRSNPRAALVELTAHLKDNPADDSTRRLIIKLAGELNPAPAIPEEARKPFVMGATVLKKASDPDGAIKAVDLFTQALNIAPWFADAYYNRAMASEAAGQFESAINDLKLYLGFKLTDSERRQALDKMYSLEADAQLVSDKKAGAAAIQEKAEREKASEAATFAWILGDWKLEYPAFPGNGVHVRLVRNGDTIIDADDTLRWRGTIQANGDIVWEVKSGVPVCALEGRWLPLKVIFSADRRRATVVTPTAMVGECVVKYPSWNSAEMTRN